MTTVTDLLDRAHTLLAKSSLPKAEYNPISELLIQAKAELMADSLQSRVFVNVYQDLKGRYIGDSEYGSYAEAYDNRDDLSTYHETVSIVREVLKREK